MKLIREDIVEKIAQDDQAAFEELFNFFYKDMCRFCLKYVRDEIVAEEIVQNLFLYIWEKRNSIKITSSVKAYLYTAVKNRSFNYIKLQLPKEQNKIDIDEYGVLEVVEENKEDEMVMEELKRQVSAAISDLPPKCQMIFNLSRNSGMTYKEIAEELDLSVKTVENQVGVALRKLRAQLQPVWDKVLILFVLFFY
ncbi:MAG: RNA polymerase sigma-70 factor [Reichenbachiella sp.]